MTMSEDPEREWEAIVARVKARLAGTNPLAIVHNPEEGK